MKTFSELGALCVSAVNVFFQRNFGRSKIGTWLQQSEGSRPIGVLA